MTESDAGEARQSPVGLRYKIIAYVATWGAALLLTAPGLWQLAYMFPLGLVAVAPEPLVEDQRVQAVQPRLQGDLPVRVPEELGVAQPRSHDAFRVFRDQPLVGRLGVDDGEERLLQFARTGHHGKVMLVMHERRRQHFVSCLPGNCVAASSSCDW